MTTIKFRYAKAPVRLDCQPTRRFVEPDHTIHLPVPRVIRSDVPNFAEDDIVPSSAEFCYLFTESSAMGGRSVYLAVPDLPSVWFDELIEVDPATLLPTAEPQAAWWAALNNLAEQIGAVPHQLGYVHQQGSASTVWDVDHNMNGFPAGIIVHGSDGHTHIPEVEYISPNRVRLNLGETISGSAYLS